MVIQRRRTLTGFGGVGCTSGPNIAPLESTNQISSSEDSNDGDNRSGLWEKQSCTESHGLLKSLNDRLSKSQGGEKGVSGSFDLLRVNLQAAFDAEIASVVSKYREKFFNQAYKNLKSNLGEHAVSESDLLLVIQKMVQQSALQFSTPPSTSPSPPSKLLFSSAPTTSCNPGPLFEMSDFEGSLDTMPTSLPMFNTTFQKYSWRSSSCTTPGEQVVGQKRKKPLQGEGQSGGMAKKPETSFEILHSTLTRPSNTVALTKDTQFVLDNQAGKLFTGVDDLTAKYPELMCYTPDNQEDLNWLANERIIPATQRNHCNVQLLLRDEVVKLKLQLDPDWISASFMGFKVPDFMLRKMLKFFTESSIKKNQRIRTASGYFDTVTTVQQQGEASRVSRRNLSTSHATLSALLAHCSDGQDNN